MRSVRLFLLLLFIGSIVYAAEFVPTTHTTAYASSKIITLDKTQTLYWISVTWKTAATRWLIVYNATAAPSNGPLDTTKVLYCGVVSLTTDGAPGTKSFDFTQHPLQYGPNPIKSNTPAPTGMVALISTDINGCDTLTLDGNNDWITAGFN